MKRSIIGAVLAASLLLAPVAYAQTTSVPIGDPYTDTVQLWGEIASALSNLANGFATLFNGREFVANSTPPSSQQEPASVVAAVDSFESTTTSATSSSNATTATSDQTTTSQNGASADSEPSGSQNIVATVMSDPAPAVNASDFVTQSELATQLNALTDSLSAKFGQPATTTPPEYVAADGNGENPFAAANAINNLSGVIISNSTIDASSIPDLSGKYLSLDGGTVTGTTTFSGGISGPNDFTVQQGSGDVGIGTVAPIDLLNVPGLANPIEAGSASTGLSGATDLYIQGRYAYVASKNNNSLVIFDISNPAAPVEVGSISTGLSAPYGIYVQGRYAYVTNSVNLVIFDISNPAAPVEVSSTATGLNGPYGVYVQGRYAYVASRYTGFVVFNISNPASPVEVSSTATGLSNVQRVYVQGRYAYTTNWGNGALVIFDISNPASPVEVSSTTTGLGSSETTGLYVQGRYAYVANAGSDSLVIFDISNPAVPVEVGSVSSSTLNGILSVYAEDRYAYVLTWDGVLAVIDISNPSAPSIVGSVSNVSGASNVYVQGRYAYVAGGSLFTFQIGGAYVQSLEAGTLQAGSLELDNNLQALDGDFTGGLTVEQSLSITGSASILSASSTYNTTANIFNIATASSTNSILAVLGNSNVGIGNTNPLSILALAGNHSNSSWTTTGANLSVANNTLTDSSSAANSTIGTRAASSFGITTFAFAVGTSTITNAANLYVAGAPLSDNASSTKITNSFAELIASNGLTGTVTTNGYGLEVNAPTGAVTNYAGAFLGGNLGAGTASPYSRLQVTGPDAASSTSAFAIVSSASTTVFAVFDGGNAELSGSLSQSSDERLKTNVTSLDASSSLSLIDELNPVTFNWIDPDQGATLQLGFIAQQVQQIFPNLVSTTSATALTPDGTLSLNYIGLISPVVSAIQEISVEITSIENTLAGFAESFVSNQITASQELCVGSTCVTPSQFQAMAAAANVSESSGEGSGGPSSADAQATDTPPVIQINGDNPAIIQVGDTYNDLGATIEGPQQDLNLGIQTYLNGVPMSPVQIDTAQAATDTISYITTDQNGLTSTSTRTVIVEAPSIVPSAAASSTDANSTDDAATSTSS